MLSILVKIRGGMMDDAASWWGLHSGYQTVYDANCFCSRVPASQRHVLFQRLSELTWSVCFRYAPPRPQARERAADCPFCGCHLQACRHFTHVIDLWVCFGWQCDFGLASLKACPFETVYARIDVVRDNDGKLSLCELELIEPELWFRNNPDAATILAKACKKILDSKWRI